MANRIFEDRPAVREATPLLTGIIGPSGTGKTYSALRMATGIQKVVGGDIHVIDTEARRSLHYAEKFKFRHLAFGAPFGPLDYLAAIEHCISKGAKTIIVDSMSHEHEGPGGVLEMHETEIKRLIGKGFKNEMSASIPAWAKPKAERRRLINTILQFPANFIFCFRAKEKLKIVPGKDPVPLGFMPQAGEEFVYELMCKFLLLPGANGFPTWASNEPGEKMMIKLPEQFRPLFKDALQLSEDVGQSLAEWSAGVPGKPKTEPVELVSRYAACSDPATMRSLEEERKALWSAMSKETKAAMKAASDSAAARIKAAEASAGDDPSAEEQASIIAAENAESGARG